MNIRLILLALFCFGSVVLLGLMQEPKPLRGVIAVPDQGRQMVREAFNQPVGKLPPGESLEAIRAVLTDLGQNLRDGNIQAAAAYFDAKRMTEEILRGEPRLNTATMRRGMERDLNARMSQLIKKLEDRGLWDSFEARKLEWLIPDREAVLVTRHSVDEDDETIQFKKRWWFIRTDSGWKIYDFEDCSLGLRAMLFAGDIMRSIMDRGLMGVDLAIIQQQTKQLNEVQDAVFDGDHERIVELLSKPTKWFVPRIGSLTRIWLAAAKIGLEEPKDALEILSEPGLNPQEIPFILELKMNAHFDLDEYEAAIEAGKAYLEALGPDADAYFTVGSSYFQLDQIDLARDYYRKAFNENPNSPLYLNSFRMTLEPEQMHELGERFAKVKQPERMVLSLVSQAIDDQDWKAAETLIAAFEKLKPNDLRGKLARAQWLLNQKQTPEAEKLLVQIVKEHPDTILDNIPILSRCIWIYIDVEPREHAYRLFASFDRRKVFRFLMESFLRDELDFELTKENLNPIKALVEEHRKQDATDPWLLVSQAKIHSAENEHDEAEKLLAKAVKLVDRNDQMVVREQWIESMVEGGHPLEAFTKIDSSTDTFLRIANTLEYKKQIDPLSKLLELYRKANPEPEHLSFWEAQILWLKRDYVEAAKGYRQHQQTFQSDSRYQWLRTDRYFRSLIRSKQFKDAEAFLSKEPPERIGNRRAILLAAKGDLNALTKELESLAKTMLPISFHYDEDLGEALRNNPKFQPLLEKYPIPKNFKPLEKEL